MGKFSTGLLAGAMLGIGMMMVDKKTVRRMKRMVRQMPHHFSL